MKLKLYDYSGLRPSRLGERRFSHLLLILSWVAYFVLFWLTEKYIPAENCHVVHCGLDDLIPFHEAFIIPYCLWYAVIFGSLLFFLLFDVDSFRSLQTYILITQAVAVAVYLIWPSRQELRPEVFARDNILTRLTAAIYSADTNTGVCPSLHVGYALAVASAWRKKPDAPRALRAFAVFFAVLICAAVCFVKQHSAVDVIAALPMCLAAELIVYWKSYWKPRLMRR